MTHEYLKTIDGYSATKGGNMHRHHIHMRSEGSALFQDQSRPVNNTALRYQMK
jgi:hypothetical protein